MEIPGFVSYDPITHRAHFNKKVCYKAILRKLKEDFLSRWNTKSKPSPDTGLQGFAQMTVLGQGAFGKVILVKHKRSGICYAVKRVSKDETVASSLVQGIYNEKKIMECVSFPFILSLAWTRKDNDYLYYGLPFLTGGTLESLFDRLGYFTEREARFYVAQVLLALEYLHHMSVIHRDLKTENIMLDARGYLKLADYGLSTKINERTLSFAGTIYFIAPEIWSGYPYDFASDWWSFGVLLFYMVNGEPPFDGANEKEICDAICTCKYEMPNKFSAALKDLLRNILELNPETRFGSQNIENIKYHPWFSKMNWRKLLNQELPSPCKVKVFNYNKYIQSGGQIICRPTAQSRINKHEELFYDF